MKKTTKTTKPATTTVSMTRAELEQWRQSEEGREATRRAAAIRDENISFKDIPEVRDFSKFLRVVDHPKHPLYRAVTQAISIRMNAPDVEAARQLAKKKALPYQTYIKMLLHEALEREMAQL